MKIIVTGGAGFIGSHLVDLLLDKGHKVACVDNLYLGRMKNIEHNMANKKFKFYKYDILNFNRLLDVFKKERCDAVFHLIANSDISHSLDDTGLDLRLNFLSTCNVLEAMRMTEVKEIIFASTSAIFGETNKVITEDMGPLVPISFYGASKLAAEAYISAYVHNFAFRAWIIRFPNVVGERATHGILYDFMRKLKRDSRKLEVLGDGRQDKPYLYVGEIVKGMIYVWKNAREGYNSFNMGTETTIKVSRIADILLEELSLKGKTHISYTGGDRGWIGDVPRYRYSLLKANKLGWHSRLTSEEAIRLSVQRLRTEFGI